MLATYYLRRRNSTKPRSPATAATMTTISVVLLEFFTVAAAFNFAAAVVASDCCWPVKTRPATGTNPPRKPNKLLAHPLVSPVELVPATGKETDVPGETVSGVE